LFLVTFVLSFDRRIQAVCIASIEAK